MKGYRPSSCRDAEVNLEIQARRAGSKIHNRKIIKRSFNRNYCTHAKLTDDEIRWVRANWNKGDGTLSIAAMSRKLNVRTATIAKICHGRAWKEIV